MKGRFIQLVFSVFAIGMFGCASTPETTPTEARESPMQSHGIVAEQPAAPPADSAGVDGTDELATVYFVNTLDVWAGLGQRSRKVPVFVDGEPVGLLPDQAFTRTFLEPGYHDVYPSQWIYFEAGHTYLLMTTGGFDQWIFADPDELADMKCAEATLSMTDRDQLLESGWRRDYAESSKKSWQRHLEFMDSAGIRPPNRLLPMTVKAARCRGGPGDKVYGNQLIGGEITIDESGIRCRRGNSVLSIPAEEILHFSYSRYHGFPYLEVDYGDPAKPYHAEFGGLLVREDLWVFTFKQRHYEAEHFNLIFQAVEKSVESCEDRTEHSAAIVPSG